MSSEHSAALPPCEALDDLRRLLSTDPPLSIESAEDRDFLDRHLWGPEPMLRLAAIEVLADFDPDLPEVAAHLDRLLAPRLAPEAPLWDPALDVLLRSAHDEREPLAARLTPHLDRLAAGARALPPTEFAALVAGVTAPLARARLIETRPVLTPVEVAALLAGVEPTSYGLSIPAALVRHPALDSACWPLVLDHLIDCALCAELGVLHLNAPLPLLRRALARSGGWPAALRSRLEGGADLPDDGWRLALLTLEPGADPAALLALAADDRGWVLAAQHPALPAAAHAGLVTRLRAASPGSPERLSLARTMSPALATALIGVAMRGSEREQERLFQLLQHHPLPPEARALILAAPSVSPRLRDALADNPHLRADPAMRRWLLAGPLSPHALAHLADVAQPDIEALWPRLMALLDSGELDAATVVEWLVETPVERWAVADPRLLLAPLLARPARTREASLALLSLAARATPTTPPRPRR